MPYWAFDSNANTLLDMTHPDLAHVLREALANSPLEFTIASSSVRTPEEQLARIERGENTTMDSRHVVRIPRCLYSDITGMPIHPEVMSHAADLIIYRGENREIDASPEAAAIIAREVRNAARRNAVQLYWGGSMKPPKLFHFELCSVHYPARL